MQSTIARIRKIVEVSLVKTLYLNIKYFGLKGIAYPYILVSRYTKIHASGGRIIVNGVHRFGIRIGFTGIDIFDGKRQNSIFSNNGTIEFNGYCHLGSGSRISNVGTLVFGNNFNITANSTIVCHDKIVFGNDVLCSWNCMFIDTDFHHIDNNINHSPIYVGNRVWICQNVTILKGSSISDGSVCAANSFIHKKFEECNLLIAGNSEIIRRKILWER